jgi:acyl-CoA thioester hydrolase
MSALTTRRRVEFRDTDAAGIVHFSAFFFWMESAEHELLRQAGIRVVERSDSAEDGVASVPGDFVPGEVLPGEVVSWPRVSVSCDYIAAVRFGDEVDIAVTVADIGRTSVTYAFAFSTAGRPVASGLVIAVRCRLQLNQLQEDRRPEPVTISADIRARLQAFHAEAGPEGTEHRSR